MSTVQPLRETALSEDGIDIKSEADVLIGQDLSFVLETPILESLQWPLHRFLLALLLRISKGLQAGMELLELI